MKRAPICVTDFDMQRLRKLLGETLTPIQPHMEYLLDQAVLVSPEKVPVDFVTLNTRLRIKDVGSGEEQSIQLVFPGDADPTCGKVSIFTPLGAALIGRSAGVTVECRISYEARFLLIEEITY